MASSSPRRSLRRELLLVAAAGLALLVAVAGERLLRGEPSERALSARPEAAAAAAAAEQAPRSEAGPSEAAGGDGSGRSGARAVAPPAAGGATRLTCLARADREPIAGLWAFAGTERRAGPSRADGVLELERPPGRSLTIWGEGWAPVTVREREAIPEVVLFDARDARLVVELAGLRPGDAVVRTLLEPRERAVEPDGPWRPRLSAAGAGRLVADRLPAGAYDVYVWVARGTAGARALSASDVVASAGETARVTLDAGAAPATER